jgi:hypothetical protein
MTELVLRRDAKPYQDRARLYRVRLDGREVESIAAGEEKRLAVEPGAHTLQLTIDWCRSNLLDLDIRSGEAQGYSCGPNASPLLGLLYATVLRNRYLYVRRESIVDAQHGQSSTAPLAGSTTGSLPSTSSRRYENVLLALILGVAIVGVVAFARCYLGTYAWD